jgi:hypothetical protein
MQDINLNSWEEFENQLEKLENERLQNNSLAKFLYRGQEDHTLNLLTTLERNGREKISLIEYHKIISMVKPQIESFTKTNWNILSYSSGIEKWLNENSTLIPQTFGWSPEFQDTYSYMAYLRHYGFPSPFLDWSSSPYIAAYFAFKKNLRVRDNKTSIYVYLESTSPIRAKYSSITEPLIYRFGPYVRTDPRHFLQQCQYTICIVLHNGEWRYESHEEVFARCNPNQDCLWKFNIPYSEQLKVLKYLDGYNINAYSLFGSDESLMETMTLREIHFKD